MIVQWCCKGIAGLTLPHVRQILTGGEGIECGRRHFKKVPSTLADTLNKLDEKDLDQHLHNFAAVRTTTAFISLSAGCVERNPSLARNVVHPARRTALAFATDWGQSAGWLFTCYVFVGHNPAPGIAGASEEVRELNHSRPFSPYYTEGEVAAKVSVPSRQILGAERVVPVRWGGQLIGYTVRAHPNPRFVSPRPVVSLRDML